MQTSKEDKMLIIHDDRGRIISIARPHPEKTRGRTQFATTGNQALLDIDDTEELLTRPLDEIVQGYRVDLATGKLVMARNEGGDTLGGNRVASQGNHSPNDSAFAYLRQNEAAVVKLLSSVDAQTGEIVAQWYELRRLMACRSLRDVLPELQSDFEEIDSLPDGAAEDIIEHLQEVIETELKPLRDEGLEKRLERFRATAEQALADKHEGIAKAFEKLSEQNETRSQFRPIYSEDEIDEIYEHPKTKTRKSKRVFRRHHERAAGGGYWALWSTIEWPYFIKDTWMLWCKEREGWRDRPSTLELPGGWVQKDGTVTGDNVFVGEWWNNKIYHYVPPIAQIHFPQVGEEEVFLYTCALNDPGMFDVDWGKLEESLTEKLDKRLDGLVNSIVDMLKGGSLGGISPPLGGAASAAKDALKTIVKEIISWITKQLKGAEFPPIVVTHRVTWPGGQPWSTVTYAYEGAGKKIPIPGPPDEPAGTDAVEWSGESQRPPKPKSDLMQVKKTPIYWAPSDDYGGHVFIPLIYESAQYAIAIRTEVRVIDIEFIQ
jgi:hypothetical protein